MIGVKEKRPFHFLHRLPKVQSTEFMESNEFDVHMSFKANKQELNKGKDILISGQFGFGAVPLVGSTVVTVVAVTVVVVVSVVVVSGIARS